MSGTIQESHVCVIANEVANETIRAISLWPPMNTAHEAFAVILEELEEFKAHVFTNQKRRDVVAMRKELVQTAAMCLRALHDLDFTK